MLSRSHQRLDLVDERLGSDDMLFTGVGNQVDQIGLSESFQDRWADLYGQVDQDVVEPFRERVKQRGDSPLSLRLRQELSGSQDAEAKRSEEHTSELQS